MLHYLPSTGASLLISSRALCRKKFYCKASMKRSRCDCRSFVSESLPITGALTRERLSILQFELLYYPLLRYRSLPMNDCVYREKSSYETFECLYINANSNYFTTLRFLQTGSNSLLRLQTRKSSLLRVCNAESCLIFLRSIG